MLNYIRIGNNFINLKNAYVISTSTTPAGVSSIAPEGIVIIRVEYAHAIKEFPCNGMTEEQVAATLEQALCSE